MIPPTNKKPALRQFLGALILLAAASGARAADSGYVRLLPNDGNNVYPATGLLRQWPAPGPKELWRATIGDGKTAVIVAGGRAFTSTQTDGKQWALCLDPATGRTLWKTMLATNENHHQVVGPVTTPVVDGDRVYFIPYESINGDFYKIVCPVFCLRAGDGSVVWSEGEKFVSTEGAMPLIVSNTLYISSCSRDCVLAAADKMTGKLLWKTADPDDVGHPAVFGAASSLTYQVVGGIPQIIISIHRNDNMGVNAETGQTLWHWKLPTPVGSGMVSTPVALGSRVFMSAFEAASSWGICLDMQVKDGKIEPVVRTQSDRLQCNAYHTVSIVDGAVYGFGLGARQESLQCTDLETGALLWEQAGPDWSRKSNLTVADGLIFALTKKDELVLAEANKTGYKELGRVNPGIRLGVQQQPTIFNGRLYLRGNDTVVCYQVAAAAPAP
ncbi:MAG: PQQ-binding-like beta-propeller repeat protein [Verrucomicrobiota bacterium]|jgi:outer membrane protein assembly factor BamB